MPENLQSLQLIIITFGFMIGEYGLLEYVKSNQTNHAPKSNTIETNSLQHYVKMN